MSTVNKKCPKCGYMLDSHTSISEKDATPSKGDLSICIGCATWLTFEEDLSYKIIKKEQLDLTREKEPGIAEVMDGIERRVKQIIADKKAKLN